MQEIEIVCFADIPKDYTGKAFSITALGEKSFFWFKYGKHHREDGPASIYADGTKYWFLNGIQYSEKDFNIEIEKMKFNNKTQKPTEIDITGSSTFDKVPGDFSGIVFTIGDKSQRNNHWFKNGQRHREDGPATIYSTGDKEYYLENFRYSEQAFNKEILKRKQKESIKDFPLSATLIKLLEENNISSDVVCDSNAKITKSEEEFSNLLKSGYEGCIYRKERMIDAYIWVKNGNVHRDDGPSTITNSGHVFWCKEGKFHRKDGPAKIYPQDSSIKKEWWLEGQQYREKMDFEKALIKLNLTPNQNIDSKIIETKEIQNTNFNVSKELLESCNKNGISPELIHDGVNTKIAESSLEFQKLKDAKFTGCVYRVNFDAFTWLKEGNVHKDNGPATFLNHGELFWIKDNSVLKVHDEKVTSEIYVASFPNTTYTSLPKDFTGIAINSEKNRFWYKNGELHRENGPAIECSSGKKEWWLEGRLHRENGPAVEYPDGTKRYYLEGFILKDEFQYNDCFLFVSKTLRREIELFTKTPIETFSGVLIRNDGSIDLLHNGKLLGKIKNASTEDKEAMVEAKSYKDRVIGNPKKEIKDASWNVGVNHFIEAIRDPLVNVLTKSAGDNNLVKQNISYFLSTDLGKSTIAAIFAFAMPAVETMLPEKYREISSKLSEKLRTKAYESALNMLVTSFSGPLKKAIESSLDKVLLVESLDKIRVNIAPPEKEKSFVEKPEINEQIIAKNNPSISANT